jgi:hypothetical protein
MKNHTNLSFFRIAVSVYALIIFCEVVRSWWIEIASTAAGGDHFLPILLFILALPTSLLTGLTSLIPARDVTLDLFLLSLCALIQVAFLFWLSRKRNS